MKANKQDFIKAFCYCFGSTKKEAERTYKTTTESYKQEVIKGYKQDARKAFTAD